MKYPVPTPVLVCIREQIYIYIGLQYRPIINTQNFPRLLSEAGLKVEDIDVYEINEAFASQATMCLSKSMEKMEGSDVADGKSKAGKFGKFEISFDHGASE